MNNVTLVSIDTKFKHSSLKMLKRQSSIFDFAKTIFFSNSINDDSLEIVQIQDLIGKKSGYSYSYFCLKELPKYINTEFCLVVQHDGFIINPDVWTEEFMYYDYVGAPWPDNYVNRVGNGGFSLRSKKFLDACIEIFKDVEINEHEDLLACVHYYDKMKEFGVKFAPPDLAAKFSLEHWTEYHLNNNKTFPTFGFHGTFTNIGKAAINENNNNIFVQSS